MKDDKYIKELKESATRKKLPTANELGEGYESPLKEKTGNETEVPEKSNQEESEPKPEKKENKQEILNKTRDLYDQGKTPEEILQNLREQNYSYEAIEDAIMSVTGEEDEGESGRQTKGEEKKETESRWQTGEETPKKDKEVEGEETPRKEEKTSEIEEIKKRLDAPSLEESKKTQQFISDEKMEYAPLFIKVEKYRETLETVENLENYLKAMSKLFEIVNKLEKIRTKNISALTKMYNRAMQTASKLYGGLLKPKGMKFEGGAASESEIEKMDTVIKDLNEELESLKGELDKIRNVE